MDWEVREVSQNFFFVFVLFNQYIRLQSSIVSAQSLILFARFLVL